MSVESEAEDALREQAALLDNAQRIGRMGSWSMDLRTGRLVWPAATCHLFGITPAEFTGTFEQFHSFIVPEDVPAYDAANARLSESEPLFEAEYRIRRPDGAVRWMYSRGRAEADAMGVLVRRVGMVMDITEQHLAREQLAENAAMLRIAGRVARLGGWTLLLPDRTLTWSDENCAIHDVPPGYKPTFEEGIGYYPPESRAEVAQHVDACERDGTPYDFELPKITATGRRIWVRSIGEAVRDGEGRIVRLQGAFQDITDRKQLEQQYLRAQRMESIGRLAGGIAHDLNNVLAPILLSIGLLQEDEHDAERLSTLAAIEASAKRGAAMISRVLSFGRGMEGQRVEVQVMPLVRDLATIVRDTFPKNIRFEDHISADLWTLQADPTQLHQVLLNLCVNARDAMPDGGTISITAKNVVLDEAYAAMNIDARIGPYVTIEVEDTGTGISKAIIDKIFDPFFTTKEIGKGTGLGLAMSLAIVKGHEGLIRVYSDPGTSTRFRLYLPAQTTPAAPASEVATVSRPRGNGETVLVVDDEAFVRQIAQRTLEAFGYRVLLASDGAEAVALYAQHQAEIAVVLTDMMMPVMNGPEAIQELVRINPQVRIICASGLAADANVDGAAGARVLHFLAKPYTADTLLTAIRTALWHSDC